MLFIAGGSLLEYIAEKNNKEGEIGSMKNIAIMLDFV